MSFGKTIVQKGDHINIPGGLRIGHQISVRGRVLGTTKGFFINLQNSEDDDDTDVAFHFNPRHKEQRVIRNTRDELGWLWEERSTPFYDFTPGSKFCVCILVQDDAYKVTVNGKEFCQYKHRMDYKKVKCLALSPTAEFYEAKVKVPCREPCKGEFPRGLREGDSFRVRGVVKDGAKKFAINLICDKDGECIALNFSTNQCDETVLLNTFDGDWGPVVKGSWCEHLRKGHFFDVIFVCHENYFYIYVNDTFCLDYEFRVPIEKIQFFEITGDVIVMDVNFLEPMEQLFVKNVPSGLKKHDVVVVEGYSYGKNGFSVNLLNGQELSCDIAISVDTRPEHNKLILNSQNKGAWETELELPLLSQLKEKTPFHWEIVYLGDRFDIYFNGHKVGSFKDRNDKPITGVCAKEKAYIYSFDIRQRLDNPDINKIPFNLQTGSWMSITGMPCQNAKQLAINLQTGRSKEYEDDIALQFNPRFGDNPTTSCNSLIKGVWGVEELEHKNFPFQKLARFEINILTMDKEFRVYVNGKHYLIFQHRMDYSHVNHLMLCEDFDFYEPYYSF